MTTTCTPCPVPCRPDFRGQAPQPRIAGPQALDPGAAVAAWIEDYNTARRHCALGMRSPVACDQALAAGEAA